MKNIITILLYIALSLFANQLKAQCSSPAALPYFNGFENDTVGQTPQCFTIQNLYNTTSPAYVTTNGIHPFEGAKKLVMAGGSLSFTGYSYWVFLPAMSFDSGKTYYLSFQYRGHNNRINNDEPFKVYCGTSPQISAMANFIGGTNYWPDAYTNFKAPFTAAAQIIYIGFNYRSSSDYGNALYVDNINVGVSALNYVTICPGISTYFVSNNAASGNTYQWQVNTGSGFINIPNNAIYSGTTADTLKLNIPSTAWYGYKYRSVINSTTFSPEYVLKFSVNWTGNSSTAWENPANWSCGVLPDENTDVVVNTGLANYPLVNMNDVCGSLKLMPGTVVTVKTGIQLDVKRKN